MSRPQVWNTEIVFEGKNKYFIDYIRHNGINAFTKFALQNKITATQFDNALKASGVLSQPNGTKTYEAAKNYYVTTLRAMGATELTNAIAVKEQIKKLGTYRYKASFLVDANLNLMPEVVIRRDSGLFNPVMSGNSAELLEFYKNRGTIPVYQVMCHPGCGVRATYVVVMEDILTAEGFSLVHLDFFQPAKIDSSKPLSLTSQGLFTTTMPCNRLPKNLGMLQTDNLMQAIRVRVASELFPEILPTSNCV